MHQGALQLNGLRGCIGSQFLIFLNSDWNWLARWCVVDGVLKQDAAERWVLLQLVGGRPLIVDNKTNERCDFVLEPTILPTPEEYEDNYICGDCVRKNHEKTVGVDWD